MCYIKTLREACCHLRSLAKHGFQLASAGPPVTDHYQPCTFMIAYTRVRTNSVEPCQLVGHKEKTNYTEKHILQDKKEILHIRLQYLELPIKEFLLLEHSRGCH